MTQKGLTYRGPLQKEPVRVIAVQIPASLIQAWTMSKHFRPWNIDQTLLLPPNVRDFVPKDHVSRFIVGLVRESLDLKAIMCSYVSGLGTRLPPVSVARCQESTCQVGHDLHHPQSLETFHPRKGRLSRLPCNKCPAAMPIWTGS